MWAQEGEGLETEESLLWNIPLSNFCGRLPEGGDPDGWDKLDQLFLNVDVLM